MKKIDKKKLTFTSEYKIHSSLNLNLNEKKNVLIVHSIVL